MIVKQILLLFSTIILSVTGLPHDLNYKEKYDNLESHSSTPFFDQYEAQSDLKTLRPKEKLNLKPCSRRLNSDSSLDSDQLIQTSSHVVVTPYDSLESYYLDSQKHYAPNKNNVIYFDDRDSNKAFLQTKSIENEQESEPVTKSGENIVNYIRSPKKNKVSIIASYNPQNLSHQKPVDISEKVQTIQRPFRVLKSPHVSVEDAYDTLESLARGASPGYDNERREIAAHDPSVNIYENGDKKLSLLNHNPKTVRNQTKPINRDQNIDNSLSVQENDENYDAITYALEMEMAEDVISGNSKQNEKYNPQVLKNIAKLLSIYEQNNEEQELPSKARLVINPSRNALKAQSLKKYDDAVEDTDSIQDDHKRLKNNLRNIKSKASAEKSSKTYQVSYANPNHVANYLKSQSHKHNNDNEEIISQESNLTKESEETEIDLKSVQNNLRSTHNKNKIKSVIINHKDDFNNQNDREDLTSESYITKQNQLHHNSNSDSVKSYEDTNSEQESGENSNYFSESEQDLSLGVSNEMNKSQLSDENSNLSSSQPNNDLIVKVSPLIKDQKHLFNPELSRDQNLSQDEDENSQNYRSSARDSQSQVLKSNSRYQTNNPVSKVAASLKGRKQLTNDDSMYLSSSQEEEDSRQYLGSHKSHNEDNKSNLSDYQENKEKRVNDRYQYKMQVPEIRVKEEKNLDNDQVSKHKSSNQNLIQEVEESTQNYHSSPRDSHFQNYESDDLSESFENGVQRSNSRHQINSPVSKVTVSLKGSKLLLNEDNINQSSSQDEEDSAQYRRSHKPHDKDNKSKISDYQENEAKRVTGHYQHKVQVPKIRVKEKKHLVNDHVSNHKSSNQNLTQKVEENSQNYYSSPSDSHHQDYGIDDLSESFENKVQKSSSRHQINSPVARVTASTKGRKVLSNDDNINQSSSEEEEDNPHYRSSSDKSHDEYNKSNLSDYQENEDKVVNSRYQNKVQVPEIRVKEKKHLVNDKLFYDKSLNQEVELNIDDSNENSIQKEERRLIYPISHHKSQLKSNDNSQSADLSGSLESRNHIFNTRNQNSQIIASVKSYQKLKKEVEGRPLYHSNLPNNYGIISNNNNLDLKKEEKNLDARYQSTVSVPEIIVKDKNHVINDELSSEILSSQETEESQNYRSSPHESQNHDDSESDNLNESGENIYKNLKSRQQDSQVRAVVKSSNLKSKYEAKEPPQYRSTLPDVLLPNYDNYLNKSEIQKSEGKSLDDGYKPKISQTIVKNTMSYNNINEEGGKTENINDGYVVNISADNLNNGDSENFYSANDNAQNVDISFDHNNGLQNRYLDNMKDSTCRDKLDLSTDYAQSNEALPNDEIEQNMEIELRTGNNEQLDKDESQSDDSGCIKDKIKLSKKEILNSASRRFLNNYFEEVHQNQEDEEEKADKEDETEETESSDEIVERDVEESEQQNSEPQNSLFDPTIGKGVREFSESRMFLSESSRLVCYACSTLSDPTCWAPDSKTTVKYCQKGHDSCIQRTYEGKDALIMVRDCATSCEGETVPGLLLKYKTCEVCHSDLCNSAYTALNSLNLMVMLSAIMFVKHVF